MKKAWLFFLCAALLFLSSCTLRPDAGKDASAVETDAQTQSAEPVTAQDLLSANDTYGTSQALDGAVLRDESVRYRTEDSRRFESVAVRAAQDMLRGTLMQPDSIQVKDCVVSNCADDGGCVYYDVSFSISYAVASGERIDGGGLYSIGVRKEDESTFDASGRIARVLKAYSIFQQTEQRSSYEPTASEPDTFAAAAKQIALSHLKQTQTGKVLTARERPDGSVDAMVVWEVLCEGENDYGMRIPDVYTVYMVSRDGKIAEVDPADPEADYF